MRQSFLHCSKTSSASEEGTVLVLTQPQPDRQEASNIQPCWTLSLCDWPQQVRKKAFVVPLRTSPFLAHTNPLCICYYLGGEMLGETKQIILVPFQISASVLEGLRAHMFRLRSMKMLKYFTRNRTPTMIRLSHKPSPRSITSGPLLHSPALDIQLPCTELHFCALPILLGDLLWQDPPRTMARSPSQHDHHSR